MILLPLKEAAVRAFVASLCIVAAVAVSSAQKSAEKTPKPKNAVITLTGCVERGSMPNQFTLADHQIGKFQVSGNGIGRYLGKRVEIAGTTDTGRFKVRGGLWPSPNAAGQAGAIDPARASVAAQPGGPSSGTGDVDWPRFSVKSLRALDGECS